MLKSLRSSTPTAWLPPASRSSHPPTHQSQCIGLLTGRTGKPENCSFHSCCPMHGTSASRARPSPEPDPPLSQFWRLCQQLCTIYASLSKELLAPPGGLAAYCLGGGWRQSQKSHQSPRLQRRLAKRVGLRTGVTVAPSPLIGRVKSDFSISKLKKYRFMERELPNAVRGPDAERF